MESDFLCLVAIKLLLSNKRLSIQVWNKESQAVSKIRFRKPKALIFDHLPDFGAHKDKCPAMCPN